MFFKFQFSGFFFHVGQLYFQSWCSAGGSSTSASLLPTKTLAFGGDIWPDQPDVPAYLVSFSSWQRAKPRTLLPTLFICFRQFGTWFLHGCRNLDTWVLGLHIQSELRVTLVQSGSWNFICILECWYLILTGDTSICRMSTEHQLLILFFHWTLDGLGFCFRVVVTTDAFHNKIRKVVSVQVCDSCRVDKMTWAPWGNPVGKNWHLNRLWIYSFIAGNSSK